MAVKDFTRDDLPLLPMALIGLTHVAVFTWWLDWTGWKGRGLGASWQLECDGSPPGVLSCHVVPHPQALSCLDFSTWCLVSKGVRAV